MAAREGLVEPAYSDRPGVGRMDNRFILDWDIFDLTNRALDRHPDPVPIDDFGPYHFLEPIGKGATGEVFLAEDREAGRRVAVKFLRSAWSEPDLPRLFAREIQILARLEHAYIARLYDIGVHPNGTPFFAMEYVEGKPLDRYCRERGCTLDDKLRLFGLICGAVQYAHSRAVVHLDLKPSNILVKEDGTPKLLDFGIALHLENPAGAVNQTQLRCTPAFASPEQFRREPVGTYTDVYALGVILYELLAGRHPYDVEDLTPSEAGAMLSRAGDPPKPSSWISVAALERGVWSDLDVLCLKAMKADAGERYRSVVELMQDLDRFRRNEPLHARPDRLSYRAGKFLRRHRRTVTASAAVFLLIVAVITFYTIRLTRARDLAVAQSVRTERIQRFMLSLFGGDYNAAPSGELRVVDILDQGVTTAQMLKNEPVVQAEVYETLGGIFHSLGKLDRADSLLTSGLEEKRSVLGADSPEVAASMTTLAILRIDQARYAEAEQLLRNAVAIERRHLPPNDPKLGNSLSSLGSVLVKRGAFAGAIQTLDEAIRIQSVPGAEKAALVDSLTYAANAYHGLGQDDIAEPLHRRILSLDRQIYGERHPSVAEDLMNLGEVDKQIGAYADAERNERQGIAMIRAWYGPDHYELAIDKEGLAETLIYEHQYEEAARLVEEALATVERVAGKDHPYTAFALNLRGLIALKQRNLQAARDDFERMVQIYRATFGERDRHVAMALLRLGQLYTETGELPKAEQSLRDSVSLYSQAFSSENVLTGTARIELGHLLLRQGRFREAEAELLAGYRLVISGRRPALEAAVNARRDLISVYEALQLPDKAGKFRAEQEATAHQTPPPS